MKKLRFVLWALVVTAAIIFGALFYARAPDADRSMATTPMSRLGGNFTLTGADGQPFHSNRLAGKPYVIFFGFTNCPDVCPTTLARLVRLRQQLGAGDQAFAIVFVTVDPERDGPAEMRDYVQLFKSPVVGLTGSPAQIAQVKKQFGIFSQKAPDGNGGYSVDHTATALLFDRTGNFQSTIAADEGDGPALDKLKRLTSDS